VLCRPSIDTKHGARLLTGGFGAGEAEGCALDWETVSRKQIRTGAPIFKWRREREGVGGAALNSGGDSMADNVTGGGRRRSVMAWACRSGLRPTDRRVLQHF
jgi:hypothetical protein